MQTLSGCKDLRLTFSCLPPAPYFNPLFHFLFLTPPTLRSPNDGPVLAAAGSLRFWEHRSVRFIVAGISPQECSDSAPDFQAIDALVGGG